MMAAFTIYMAPTRPCPLAFTGGEFWKEPENFSLTVRNTGGKPISKVRITSEMFVAPGDLRRPRNFQWSSTKTILPGEEQTLEKPGMSAKSAQSILGWVFFPAEIQYQDGSVWDAQTEGECFKVIWRDAEHPEVPALPPRQIEINAD
jgi:hypothetical protein